MVDRSRLPAPAAARAFVFPAIRKSVLPSGLRVWTAAHAGLPILSVLLLLRMGSASDPEGQEGLAALTADMLDEGSGSRSAIQMHEELARIGAHLDADISPDASTLTISSLSRFADRALMLLADMVARPALTEADVLRVRQLRLHRLTQLRDIPGAVADRTFARLLYGAHPVRPQSDRHRTLRGGAAGGRRACVSCADDQAGTGDADRLRRLRSRRNREAGFSGVRRVGC